MLEFIRFELSVTHMLEPYVTKHLSNNTNVYTRFEKGVTLTQEPNATQMPPTNPDIQVLKVRARTHTQAGI
jgi:hypothetical protein